MKDEINEILDLLETDRFSARLRALVRALNAEQGGEIDSMIAGLNSAVSQVELSDHDYLGIYYFFLGCCYWERNDHLRAIRALSAATAQMWNSVLNRALCHLLLGMIYSKIGNHSKARKEVNTFVKLYKRGYTTFVRQTGTKPYSRSQIEIRLKKRLKEIYGNPLFGIERDVAPTNSYPLQDSQELADEPDILVRIPVSVSVENYPVNTVVNESNPINKVTNDRRPTDQRPPPHMHAGTPEAADAQSRPHYYETRSDQSGYIVIQDLPVYRQRVRASQSGKAVIDESQNQAEIYQIVLEGKLHALYSLRPGNKRINVTRADKWGWMRVEGHSMNCLDTNTLSDQKMSIDDGDYVLFRRQPVADDNDIVIVYRVDDQTAEGSMIVKRFKKSFMSLTSETTERGPEFDPIHIDKAKIAITGVVYAVAKQPAHKS